MSAGQINRIDPAGQAYNFDMIDGVGYQIDLSQLARYNRDGTPVAPQAHRIPALQYQGKPIDDVARFVVLTNTYRASGSGSFPGLDGKNIIMNAPDENRAALIQDLRSNGSTDGSTDGSTSGRISLRADKHWRILSVAGIKLRFVSGAGAVTHLPRYPQISRIRDNGDGSALFKLTP